MADRETIRFYCLDSKEYSGCRGSAPGSIQKYRRIPALCGIVSTDFTKANLSLRLIMKMDPERISFTETEIYRLVKLIYGQALAESDDLESGNFNTAGTPDLKLLFRLYDHCFFGDYFSREYRGWISFRLSQRMTKTGGKVEYLRKDDAYRITLSTFLIFRSFQTGCREIKVNGIVCRDRLEAVMRILEHEIVHLLELTSYGNSSCKQKRFKKLARQIFAHTDVTHQLITQPEIAHRHYDLHAGDEVTFEFDRRKYTGIIDRINKRATVMVRDKKGHFRDDRGKRYLKFYIPLPYLTPVKDGD